MTTPPNSLAVQSVNNNTTLVLHSSDRQQSTPQNLSSSHSSEVQIEKRSTSPATSAAHQDILVAQDAPLSLTKVLVPAQVAVVAHPFPEQAAHQQPVLFQALTAQAAPHFITLAVPTQDGQRQGIAIQTSEGTPCIQYIDEGGGTNVFSAANNQMTTFSIYTSPEAGNMFTANSAAYFNTTTSSEDYAEGDVSESKVQDSSVNSYSEEQNVYVLDESNIAENSQLSNYTSSRLSTLTITWLLDNYEMAEGMSVPRSTMYSHYLNHCSEQKMEPLNSASFGKLIRAVFTGLRTRRLGTRGNSKYHYYGIRLKKSLDDIMNYKHIPIMQVRKLKTDIGSKDDEVQSKHFEMSDAEKNKIRQSQKPSNQVLLGDTSSAIPDVDIDISDSSLPSGITVEKINNFKVAYRKHCEAILEAVINFQFAIVESLWHLFWNTDSDSNSDNDISTYMSQLLSYHPIQEFIKQTDYHFYQNLVDVLIPDVFRPIPSTLTQAIRTFAKSLEGWLKSAISHYGDEILKLKLSAISAFAQTLRRYTSLNHLAQAARAVLQSPTQIKQMIADLNKVDFRNIQEQASWVCQCDDDSVRELLNEFRRTLQHHLWLEEWAAWLENIVHKTLEPYAGKPTYPKAARQFLLKWSFYSSLVIRDLTLRSAASFGSFHLLRLLYDEYMFFVIEHCIAKETSSTSIAVLGEYLCSGKPEGLVEMPDLLKINKDLCFDEEEEEPKEMDHNGCGEEK